MIWSPPRHSNQTSGHNAVLFEKPSSYIQSTQLQQIYYIFISRTVFHFLLEDYFSHSNVNLQFQ